MGNHTAHSVLNSPIEKKSQGFKSGERAGHKTGPLRPIHRFSKLASNQFLTPRAL
jgi:hypothetical protein